MERGVSVRELAVVVGLMVVGAALVLLAAGIGWKLLGLWLVVGTAFVFVMRGNGPVGRSLRDWLRKRTS